VRVLVLAPLAFAHCATDRLALADARANRVGGRPLGASFGPPPFLVEDARASGRRAHAFQSSFIGLTMKAYFVLHIKLKDDVEYKKYLDKCDSVFNKYKGRYLAVDEKFIVVEGKDDSSRIVIIEFNNEFEFNEWYNSKDYQDIIKHRLNGSDCNSILVHGK
jgi:uncharacterized protein (DUF1330 family)